MIEENCRLLLGANQALTDVEPGKPGMKFTVILQDSIVPSGGGGGLFLTVCMKENICIIFFQVSILSKRGALVISATHMHRRV